MRVGLLMKVPPREVMTPSRRSLFAGRIGTGNSAPVFWLTWMTKSTPRPPGMVSAASPAKTAEQVRVRPAGDAAGLQAVGIRADAEAPHHRREGVPVRNVGGEHVGVTLFH